MAKQAAPEEEQVSESYISVGLGLLVVVVVGILLYNYFTSRGTKPTDAEKAEQDRIAEEATMSAKPGTTYTVAAGDTLWSIAEKAYQSGYNWVDIATANNLTGNEELNPGQTLVIPDASPKTLTTEVGLVLTPTPTSTTESTEPTPQPTPEPSPEQSPLALASAAPISSPAAIVTPSITGSSYKVVAGDTLWNIACRAYGDCYAWTRIAQANKLINPDLIHPGNEFTLPR